MLASYSCDLRAGMEVPLCRPSPVTTHLCNPIIDIHIYTRVQSFLNLLQHVVQPNCVPQPPRHNLNIPLVRLPIPPDRLHALSEARQFRTHGTVNATHKIETRYPRQRAHEPLARLIFKRSRVYHGQHPE